MLYLPKKKTIFIFVVIILLLAGLYLFWQFAPSISRLMGRISRIDSSECSTSQWETFDRPDLSGRWLGKLNQAGIRATDVSISSKREGRSCLTLAALGLVYRSEAASTASSSKVYGTIQVDSVSDDAILGEIVQGMLMALEPKAPYGEFYNANIHLTFVGEQNKEIDFYLYEVRDLQKRGLGNAELFQALDGRLSLPIVTPVPTKE